MAGLTIDQAAALALRGTTTSGSNTAAAPSLASWFIDLVPQNPFMFRTTANVTGTLTLAAMLPSARGQEP